LIQHRDETEEDVLNTREVIDEAKRARDDLATLVTRLDDLVQSLVALMNESRQEEGGY
jgi:hypothetical protein